MVILKCLFVSKKVAFVMLIKSPIPRTRTLTRRMKEKIYLVIVGLLNSTMEEPWKKIDSRSDEVFSICDSLCICSLNVSPAPVDLALERIQCVIL